MTLYIAKIGYATHGGDYRTATLYVDADDIASATEQACAKVRADKRRRCRDIKDTETVRCPT